MTRRVVRPLQDAVDIYCAAEVVDSYRTGVGRLSRRGNVCVDSIPLCNNYILEA